MPQLDSNTLIPWLEQAIERLSPAEQRKLAREIGKQLRVENRKRITAQTSPEGQPWAPRKKGKGKRPTGKMFKKLRTASRLKIKAQAHGVKIGWAGQDGHIARVHQYGLRQRLQWGEAQYPARALLGFAPKDVEIIKDLLIERLAPK